MPTIETPTSVTGPSSLPGSSSKLRTNCWTAPPALFVWIPMSPSHFWTWLIELGIWSTTLATWSTSGGRISASSRPTPATMSASAISTPTTRGTPTLPCR